MSSRIYLSAVVPELSEARAVMAYLLRGVGMEVVYEEGFLEEAGDAREKVRAAMAGCDGVMQLVGQRYGGASLEDGMFGGPLSYAQYEGEFARRSGRRIFYVLLGPRFGPATERAQTPQEQAAQDAYRWMVETKPLPNCRVETMDGLDAAFEEWRAFFSSRPAGGPAPSGDSAEGALELPDQTSGASPETGHMERKGEESGSGLSGDKELPEVARMLALYSRQDHVRGEHPALSSFEAGEPADLRGGRRHGRAWALRAAALLACLLLVGGVAWKMWRPRSDGETAGASGPAGEGGAASGAGEGSAGAPRADSETSGKTLKRGLDLLADPDSAKDGPRTPPRGHVSPEAARHALTGRVVAGTPEAAFVSVFRAFPVRMLDEPVMCFHPGRFLASDDARKTAGAIAEMAAENNLEAPLLEQDLRAFAAALLRDAAAPPLDRARALFFLGRYAEAEQAAGEIVQESAQDFVAAGVLAAASAIYRQEPDRAAGYLKSALAAAVSAKLVEEQTLVDFLWAGLDIDRGLDWSASESLSQLCTLNNAASGAENPLLARLRNAYGVALAHLNQWPEAEREFREAARLSSEHLGAENRLTLAYAHNLGLMLARRNEPGAHEQLCQILASRERTLGAEHPHTLLSRCALADEACCVGRVEEGVGLYRATIELAKRLRGPADEFTVGLMQRLGWALFEHDHRQAAEQTFREIAAAVVQPGGGESTEMIANFHDLGRVLNAEGKFAEALPVFQKLVELSARKGASDAFADRAALGLGAALLGVNRAAEAEAIFRARLKTRRPGDPLTTELLAGLGDALSAQLKFKEAAPVLQDALTRREKNPGPEDIQTCDAMVRLGVAEYELADLKGAETLWRRALAAHERNGRAETAAGLQALHFVVLFLERQRRYEEARPLAARLVAGEARLAEKAIDSPIDLTENQQRYGTILNALGQSAQALPYFTKVVQERTKKLGPLHADTLASLIGYANAQAGIDQRWPAYQTLRETLDKCDGALGTTHPVTIECLEAAAPMALRCSEPWTAEPLYQRLADYYAATYGKNDKATLAMVMRFASVLETNHKYSVAETVFKRATEGYTAVVGRDAAETCLSLVGAGRCVVSQGRPKEIEIVKGFAERSYREWSAKFGPSAAPTRAAAELIGQIGTIPPPLMRRR